jgi:hypothetical protein
MVPRQHGTAVCDRVFMVDENAFIHEAFIAPEALRTERKALTVALRKPSPRELYRFGRAVPALVVGSDVWGRNLLTNGKVVCSLRLRHGSYS